MTSVVILITPLGTDVERFHFSKQQIAIARGARKDVLLLTSAESRYYVPGGTS